MTEQLMNVINKHFVGHEDVTENVIILKSIILKVKVPMV